MTIETLDVSPSAKVRHVVNAEGEMLAVPDGWILLEPGDAALSRRIKKDGPTWTMKEKKGRRLFSKGIWAPADRIAVLRAELEQERLDPSYQKKLDAGRKRREKEQVAYAADFESSVRDYLSFAPVYDALAMEMAKQIADHATPVGSGTVARTKRISIEQRAEAATIAWMRHQTTAYDDMVIPRVKGQRREVRKQLAQRSKQLLNDYRNGAERPQECPLAAALKG
ncbi:DUF2293 domain-containing protein [Leucothrix arctica]|uniref:DUF2293 domain-containing protein n=1 Tax=Leucothrix arctica TaxID=1481894 RepID=A0A317C828_9GAMM|nr:DUF2293 domain-containing protein [Leucothrix arctica]PWQ94734.1 DUF2293 domain-containing protein [Leucothrix arctica]